MLSAGARAQPVGDLPLEREPRVISADSPVTSRSPAICQRERSSRRIGSRLAPPTNPIDIFFFHEVPYYRLDGSAVENTHAIGSGLSVELREFLADKFMRFLACAVSRFPVPMAQTGS